MKKFTALLLALMMVFAFAACGETSEEPAPEPETTEAAQTQHEVSGIVEDIADANLSIYTEAAQNLTFNIENAAIDSEDGINPGDTAIVTYEGEVSGGDTSGCTVTNVVDVPGTETIIEGKVESIGSDGTVTISSNSKKYTFKAKDSGSAKVGETVKVKYAGIIEGDDTSHAFVKSMEAAKETEATEATKNSVSIKAVDETVYAAARVNVRAEASTTSDRIATVKKGTKLTRTGVLSNGWSRVEYKGKDRYIASSFLTTKAPKKQESTKATKATETKATKATETKATKATETKATETKTEPTETKTEPTETQTDPTETQTDPTETQTEPTESQTEATEPPTEETEPPTEETEPPTLTAKGVVTAVGSNSITLDNGVTYNLKGAKVTGLDASNAVGQTVQVEYYENSKDAVSVYVVDGSKALGESESGMGGAATIAIILALIAIAIAVVIVVMRNRRKTAAK